MRKREGVVAIAWSMPIGIRLCRKQRGHAYGIKEKGLGRDGVGAIGRADATGRLGGIMYGKSDTNVWGKRIISRSCVLYGVFNLFQPIPKRIFRGQLHVEKWVFLHREEGGICGKNIAKIVRIQWLCGEGAAEMCGKLLGRCFAFPPFQVEERRPCH